MSEQSSLDTLVATLVGAVLFSAVIAAVVAGYSPPSSAAVVMPVDVPPSNQVTRPTPTATLTPPATATLRPTAVPTAIPTLVPSPTAEPTIAVYEPEDHYWFERPIASDGINFVSRFYTYGATYRGRYQVHHGVEFENPTGTPIMAVGPGEVVYAGPDDEQAFGKFPNFYGRLVIIKHDRDFHGQPVFTLYGHVSTEKAEIGQRVETGQVIAEVGSSGIALGPHLHMEVRVGENDYAATRDPELWIKPFNGYGTIAGRLTDTEGVYVPGVIVNLFNAQNTWIRDAETYGAGVNPDEGWQENFVFGDVPAGQYTVYYETEGAAYTEPVQVSPGKTVLVTLEVPVPPTPEPTPSPTPGEQ